MTNTQKCSYDPWLPADKMRNPKRVVERILKLANLFGEYCILCIEVEKSRLILFKVVSLLMLFLKVLFVWSSLDGHYFKTTLLILIIS